MTRRMNSSPGTSKPTMGRSSSTRKAAQSHYREQNRGDNWRFKQRQLAVKQKRPVPRAAQLKRKAPAKTRSTKSKRAHELSRAVEKARRADADGSGCLVSSGETPALFARQLSGIVPAAECVRAVDQLRGPKLTHDLNPAAAGPGREPMPVEQTGMPTRWTFGEPDRDGLLPLYSVATTKKTRDGVATDSCRVWPAELKALGTRLAGELPKSELARVGVGCAEYFNSAQVMLYRGTDQGVVVGKLVSQLNWHHDARSCGGDHGYEDGSFIGSLTLAGDMYFQMGNSRPACEATNNNWSQSGLEWAKTWKLGAGDGFLFSAADDAEAAHRVVRRIESKALNKYATAAQKRSWKGHASLPALARKDRVEIVFRRMPAADFHRFADEYPHWLAQ